VGGRGRDDDEDMPVLGHEGRGATGVTRPGASAVLTGMPRVLRGGMVLSGVVMESDGRGRGAGEHPVVHRAGMHELRPYHEKAEPERQGTAARTRQSRIHGAQ